MHCTIFLIPTDVMHHNASNVVELLRHTERMADGECWVSDYAPSTTGYISGSRRQLHVLAWEAYHAQPGGYATAQEYLDALHAVLEL